MDRFWLAILAGAAMIAASAAILPLRSAPGAAAAATVNVDVGDNFFANQSPGSHMTTISVGDKVHWVWIGSNGHSVTYDGCPANCLFDDPPSSAKTSGSFDFTFNTSGSYNYHCVVHPGMTGTIVVQAAAAATPTNTSSAATNTAVSGTATATRTATATGTTTVVATSTPVPAASSTPPPAVATPTHPSGSPGGVSQLPSTGAGANRERSGGAWTSVALAAAGASIAGGSVVARLRRRRAS